jgi:hypothetical protein
LFQIRRSIRGRELYGILKTIARLGQVADCEQTITARIKSFGARKLENVSGNIRSADLRQEIKGLLGFVQALLDVPDAIICVRGFGEELSVLKVRQVTLV